MKLYNWLILSDAAHAVVLAGTSKVWWAQCNNEEVLGLTVC